MAECLSGENNGIRSIREDLVVCLVVDMVTGDSGTLSLYAVFWFLVSTLKEWLPSTQGLCFF